MKQTLSLHVQNICFSIILADASRLYDDHEFCVRYVFSTNELESLSVDVLRETSRRPDITGRRVSGMIFSATSTT